MTAAWKQDARGSEVFKHSYTKMLHAVKKNGTVQMNLEKDCQQEPGLMPMG